MVSVLCFYDHWWIFMNLWILNFYEFWANIKTKHKQTMLNTFDIILTLLNQHCISLLTVLFLVLDTELTLINWHKRAFPKNFRFDRSRNKHMWRTSTEKTFQSKFSTSFYKKIDGSHRRNILWIQCFQET